MNLKFEIYQNDFVSDFDIQQAELGLIKHLDELDSIDENEMQYSNPSLDRDPAEIVSSPGVDLSEINAINQNEVHQNESPLYHGSNQTPTLGSDQAAITSCKDSGQAETIDNLNQVSLMTKSGDSANEGTICDKIQSSGSNRNPANPRQSNQIAVISESGDSFNVVSGKDQNHKGSDINKISQRLGNTPRLQTISRVMTIKDILQGSSARRIFKVPKSAMSSAGIKEVTNREYNSKDPIKRIKVLRPVIPSSPDASQSQSKSNQSQSANDSLPTYEYAWALSVISNSCQF